MLMYISFSLPHVFSECRSTENGGLKHQTTQRSRWTMVITVQVMLILLIIILRKVLDVFTVLHFEILNCLKLFIGVHLKLSK